MFSYMQCVNTSESVCRKCVTIFEQCLQKTSYLHAFNGLIIFKFALKLEVKQGQQELEDKLCTTVLPEDSLEGVSGGFFGVAVK